VVDRRKKKKRERGEDLPLKTVAKKLGERKTGAIWGSLILSEKNPLNASSAKAGG